MKPIPYGRQHITEEDLAAVVNALKSDFLTQGPAIPEFEAAFAAYIGCKFAVAVNNGTAALHLAALAIGVNENSHVITTPVTFAASANCVRYCGGKVSFVDIDSETALMDIDKLEALLKASPRGTYSGIIPVDFAGYPINAEQFRALADEYGLWIIEDACHAPGAFFIDKNGEKQISGNGRFSEMAIYSFHPVKHIACGEGGMITTNDEELYKKLQLLRTHGITKDPSIMEENDGGWYYEMVDLGYNYRLTDFQAALGSSQLKRADNGLAARKAIAKKYDAAFAGTTIRPLQPHPQDGHAYHLYVIRVDDRKGLYDHLRRKDIFAQVHYIPVHTLPYYQSLGFKQGDFPVAEKYYSQCLSLPMYPTLTHEEQEFVINEVKSFGK
ncbi:UDP-4-amino-4,6-dideoxy-N-acetyl-beta-L-altrosamine transaminase [Terrimonas sp. NA20]|uniref:UDP-4-amino-4, 6-dideoxy-N-acetyl-beta-L-altrosamine transaminase n=1 Tax=Terrimonas ginsenosidimutans TaxID=2908004 RepID=A0ABS9KUV2_9BACT|nr:UDP-4-amino-4,6-dideoxy-N-acetyl-beta-L-altrosamine transaminase [Terrimonas ginsenosidimutans]MCG2616067.1 UDP-4-amino-4,6-dideoxy-N-acetyl-beta-L-altrosamine transaminase [Terrimonas ginsenosidimutans]